MIEMRSVVGTMKMFSQISEREREPVMKASDDKQMVQVMMTV